MGGGAWLGCDFAGTGIFGMSVMSTPWGQRCRLTLRLMILFFVLCCASPTLLFVGIGIGIGIRVRIPILDEHRRQAIHRSMVLIAVGNVDCVGIGVFRILFFRWPHRDVPITAIIIVLLFVPVAVVSAVRAVLGWPIKSGEILLCIGRTVLFGHFSIILVLAISVVHGAQSVFALGRTG